MHRIVISTSSFDLDKNPAVMLLKSNGFDIVTNPFGRRLTELEISELLGSDTVGMIAGVEPLTRKVFESARDLRVVSRCGIGMDSVDVSAAEEKGILVSNTPDAPSVAVAELTVAIILNLLRKVSQADQMLRSHRWKPLMGNLLSGKKVGIVGCGRIGKKVFEILKCFGCDLRVHDKAGVVKGLEESALPLDQLMARSDIVTLHIPYDSSTHHFLDSSKINMMKQGAFVINVSRGGLIDEQQLYLAIKSGRLGGAGLDCFEKEPYEGPLLELPQVVLTAHMGSYAKESREQMELEAANNLVEGLRIRGLLKKECQIFTKPE